MSRFRDITRPIQAGKPSGESTAVVLLVLLLGIAAVILAVGVALAIAPRDTKNDQDKPTPQVSTTTIFLEGLHDG